jgi:chemotaxis response regulator CheB
LPPGFISHIERIINTFTDKKMPKYPKLIVVIGAAAGGLNALSEMVQHLQKG